jgi:hypothetical protein
VYWMPAFAGMTVHCLVRPIMDPTNVTTYLPLIHPCAATLS